MHIKIYGNKNSYSKIDKDATFMRMKEDYMKNGQAETCIQFTDRTGFVPQSYRCENPRCCTAIFPQF